MGGQRRTNQPSLNSARRLPRAATPPVADFSVGELTRDWSSKRCSCGTHHGSAAPTAVAPQKMARRAPAATARMTYEGIRTHERHKPSQLGMEQLQRVGSPSASATRWYLLSSSGVQLATNSARVTQGHDNSPVGQGAMRTWRSRIRVTR